jgi:hypothetical protein
MTGREVAVALLVTAALAVAARTWARQWHAQPVGPGPAGVARKFVLGRSDRDTIALATATGIVLAGPLAGYLVEAVAWFAGITGLDAAAWAPAGADAVVLALVVAAVVDVAVVGLWRGAWLRPALRHSLIGLVLPTILVAGTPLLAQTTSDAIEAVGQVPAPEVCVSTGPDRDTIVGYGPQRRANAAIVVQVGQEMGVPVRGQVIAIATAMQESSLDNLDHGDRDSLGLFQQRPSQGWGSAAQVRDPRYAAQKFYEGLLRIRNWQDLPLWQAAQAVQRSGHPTAYAKHEAVAAQLVGAATNTTCRS